MTPSSATTPADGAIVPGAKAICRFMVQQRLSPQMLLVLLELLPSGAAPKVLHDAEVQRLIHRNASLRDAWDCMEALTRQGLCRWHQDPRGDAQESIMLTGNGELMLLALFGAVMLGGEVDA